MSQADIRRVEIGADPANRRRERLRIAAERAVAVSSPLILLALWEVAARVGAIDMRFFPAPVSVIQEAAVQIRNGVLLEHGYATLQRIVVGFAIGAVPAIVAGIAMGLMPFVRAALRPIINATYPIPKIAVLPLFVLLFGLGDGSKYAIIAVAVFYIVVIGTYEGVRNIDSIYFDVGQNFRAGKIMMFRDVALPGALPSVLAGLRLGMGVALLVIVAAEFSGARSGVGFLIWNSWQTFQVKLMYVGLLTTAVMGFAFSALFDALDRILLPWKRRRR